MASLVVEISGPAADKLRLLAGAENRSESEIVSDALAAYSPSKRKLPTGAGKYHSGQNDIAQNAENLLRQAVEDRKWP